MSNEFSSIVQRLEAVACRLENLPVLTKKDDINTCQSVNNTKNASVIDYDTLIKVQLDQFLKLSEKIGGDVQKAANLVKSLFLTQVDFIAQTVTRSKPSDADLTMILKPTSEAINRVVDFRETNRRSEYFNHLSSISEGIPALGWVTVSPAPCPFIKEMQDSSQFYTNRVIKDFKEKDISHVEWSKAWLSLLTELQGFVKKHFTTGITWSNRGVPTAGIQVCPIPPPPPPPAPHAPTAESDDTKKHAALFEELNKGASVTSGLKKVTDDMKTHKNPDLRAGSTVPAKESSSATGEGVKINQRQEVSKPSSMRLEGNKWVVEYFKDIHDIAVSDTSIKQTLYVFKCTGSVITVNGKINNIVLDNCKKVALVFDGLISSLDIVNCQSVQVQTLGVLPIVNIDKTDGAQIVLNSESLGVEIVSAKSSEMNVIVPREDGDVTEMALPEQFKTKLVNGKLVTSTTEDF